MVSAMPCLPRSRSMRAGRCRRNFDTYRSLRIHEMPEVEVTIVPSTEKPTGVGEPGVPPIGPAVANAMARLGLGRPRRSADRAGSSVMNRARRDLLRSFVGGDLVHRAAGRAGTAKSAGRCRRPAPGRRALPALPIASPLDRAVPRSRQGAAASALRELSSRKRQPAPDRQRCSRISRWSCAAPTATALRRFHATPATDRRISIRRTCPGIRNGISRPLAMAWEGRSLGQICEQIKDRARNGDQATWRRCCITSAEDTLVGWAWTPGTGRTPAPGTQARFGEIMRAWADAGAACPAP